VSFLQFSAGSWVSGLISFLTIPVITWLIDPEEFGMASMYTLSFNVLVLTVLLGTDQGFVRMFYEYEETDRPRLLWEAMLPPMALWGLVALVMLSCWSTVSSVLFDDESMFFPVVVLVVNVLFGTLSQYGSHVLRMKKRAIAFSSVAIVRTASNVAIVIACTWVLDRGFYAVIVGFAASTFISMGVSIFLERRFWFERVRISKAGIGKLLRYGLPFIPAFTLIWVLQSIDRIFLRNFTTFEEIGLYTAAWKIVAVMGLIQAGFQKFWAPVAFENHEKRPHDTSLYEKAGSFVAGGMFILGMLIVGVKDLVCLFLAEPYREAASIVPFLILMPVMSTVGTVTVVGISFTKKTHWHIWISGAAATASILGCLLLVPYLGARGAAVSTGIAYTVFFFFRTLVSVRLYPVDYHLVRFSASLAVFVIVAAVNTFLPSRTQLGILSSIGGTVVLLCMYWNQITSGYRLLVPLLRGKRRQ